MARLSESVGGRTQQGIDMDLSTSGICSVCTRSSLRRFSPVGGLAPCPIRRQPCAPWPVSSCVRVTFIKGCVCLCLAETERQAFRWFLQCLREQSLLLEILFLYYAYFEMAPTDLLSFTKIFKEQGFGQRQTNRHLVDKSMDVLVDRIG